MPSIAIVGASRDRIKFGNKAVRAYLKKGYRVYPIHPSEAEIEGCQVFKSVSEIPQTTLDRVSFYVPPSVGITILDGLTTKTIGEIWLNPGSESPELITRAQSLGLSVITACSIVDIGERPNNYP